MTRRAGALIAFLLAGCNAVEGPGPGQVDLQRLRNVDAEPGQWLGLGRTWKADRFSWLDQINVDNVTDVGFAWEAPFRSNRGRVEHGQEATPVMVDGVLYLSGPWGSVLALDAATGQQRWRYDPEVDGQYARHACCDVVNRGLAVWQGRVYVATLDGYLVALDAGTGQEIWRVDTFIDRTTRSYTITGPPQVANEVVVIGNSGGEYGVRGYITAYDLATGTERWRFYIVPGDPSKGPPEHPEMELALKTWDPDSDWESGLGGTVWGEMAYDPDLDLLYVGTGNSSPYPIWHRSPTGGDNLFLVSILAIHPGNGRLAWHYQTTPGEIWDYTATANLVLADLTLGGRPRKVIMQAPKNGFYYVLDRATGEFISGTPFVFQNWALGLDSTGRPIPNPDAVYRDQPAMIFPTQAGAHNWHPMAFSPVTGLTYIPAREEGMVMANQPSYQWRQGRVNFGAEAMFGSLMELFPGAREELEAMGQAKGLPSPLTREVLIAWDPVAGKEQWRMPNGDFWSAAGGVLTTAGNLVIQGTGSGHLRFYRADTGEKIHEIEVGTTIIAAPMTYEIGGVQYIAVAAGFGGALNMWFPAGSVARRYQNYGRVLAFRLGGGGTPLPPARVPGETPESPPLTEEDAAMADSGARLFGEVCAGCHLGRGEARPSPYPDLHRLSRETHAAFEDIVLRGKLRNSGMASFADLFSPEQVRMIHAYLIREQAVLRAEDQADTSQSR
ncbi:MAG TPA: PQQ-dependent dehydrogenase, methanol/ethanol family [Gemmatimonadales bacterium]|nr:PQQ-dependent dehydrogenase, methanol/ethanol family [Gemmatimonadales bacterium]